jgi:hypothetical protein
MERMAGNPEDWPVIVRPEAFDGLTEKVVPVTFGGRVVGQGTWRVDEDSDGISTELRLLPARPEIEAGTAYEARSDTPSP